MHLRILPGVHLLSIEALEEEITKGNLDRESTGSVCFACSCHDRIVRTAQAHVRRPVLYLDLYSATRRLPESFPVIRQFLDKVTGNWPMGLLAGEPIYVVGTAAHLLADAWTVVLWFFLRRNILRPQHWIRELPELFTAHEQQGLLRAMQNYREIFLSLPARSLQ